MENKQIIDLEKQEPEKTDNFSLYLYSDCEYSKIFHCWSIIKGGGFLNFKLNLPTKRGCNLIFRMCSVYNYEGTDCPINIYINGKLIVERWDPQIYDFYNKVWAISSDILVEGDNEIIFQMKGGNSAILVSKAIVDIYEDSYALYNWMNVLDDEMLIGNINIPGTHDAAAINNTIHTPYACHNQSITNQLQGGIRLLDVRLRVKKNGTSFSFMTCHGDMGSSSGLNEYQSFSSLLDECKTFLISNAKEVILMSLKIDDWADSKDDKEAALKELDSLLKNYPVISQKNLPTIGSIRSKIFLLNRINNSLTFGTPISWEDNTTGKFANDSEYRDYSVFVQDHYKGLSAFNPQDEKLDNVIRTFLKKDTKNVVWNFASATWFGIFGVYIMGKLLSYLGTFPANTRPKKLGWVMFDYEFEKYRTDEYKKLDIVRMIVSSNFNYHDFPKEFKIISHEDL